MLNFSLCTLLVPFSGSTEPVVASSAYLLDDKPVMHRWTGTLNAGVIATDGNTETRSANAAFDAQYRREKDRTTLGAYWNYQDDKSGVLQRRTGGKAKYDYFFTEKTYGLVQASAENDFQADLDLRWTAGVGVGRQFIETAERKFSGELGVSWVDESFDSSPYNSYTAARAAYTYDWTINPKWAFYNAGEIYPSLEYGDDVNAKEDTRLKVTLTDKMFAQAQWVMDWDNTPAAGKERVDNRYILTIGWAF
ncbi:MAG TPA: DUF481 domain-containing protein [Planctomycetota bacterium]|nr:DUF481 domain-containing protein [Planctomycetota bacterium]